MAPRLGPAGASGTRPAAGLRPPVALRPGAALAAEWPVITDRTVALPVIPEGPVLAVRLPVARRPVMTE